MRRFSVVLFTLCTVASLAGCRKRRAFCPEDLTGEWQHADDATYRFSVKDDGAALTMHPHREGGGVAGGPDLLATLVPAADRLKGSLATTTSTPKGRSCPVTFQWDVVACAPGQMTVRSEQEYGIQEDCSRFPGEAPDVADSDLVRVK